ncbi:hypothetical protein D3C78_1800690 [compost metagenome]
MMVLDSHSTKSSSLITGTMALGFSAMNSGLCVERKPAPQSSRSNAMSSSAQVQRTLRTLIDDALPSICSIACP